MIYPETGNHPFTDQPKYEFMGFPENIDIFHPDRDESIDIKKPAVVALVGGNLPECKPVNLLPQEFVQQVEASGLARDSVEYLDISCDKFLHFRTCVAKVPETPFEDLLFSISLYHLFRT
jgi:hypothetical protein